jgi:hypothetical protein
MERILLFQLIQFSIKIKEKVVAEFKKNKIRISI